MRGKLRERVGTIGLALAVGFAVFAVGGVFRWAVVGAALIAAATAVTQLSSHRRAVGLPPHLAFLGFAALVTLIQVVPLPHQLLDALDPTAAELIAEGAEVRGAAPASWLPLSVDPSATRLELLELMTLLAVAMVASRLAGRGRGRDRLLAIVALVAGAAAVVALGHKLVGAERLYGVYAPAQAREVMRAPLLNPNHFAALMAMGCLLGAGFALDAARDARVRVGFAASALACLIALMSTTSRGGVVALGVGAAVAIAILGAQHLKRLKPALRSGSTWVISVPAAVLLACGLVLVVYGSSTGVLHQLAGTGVDDFYAPESKATVWRSAVGLVSESPWIGIGRGAFESAFTRLHEASAQVTYSHVENEYLQAAVDWGVPAALVLAGLLAWTALAAFRQWNGGPLVAVALGALVALAAQSMVDFGAEFLGVALPAVVVLSALLPARLRELEPGRVLAVRGARVGLVALMVGLAAVVASPAGRTLHESQAALEIDDGLPGALAAMARHPLDYLASGRAATAAMRDGAPSAAALLNHALRLHPSHPDLHRLVARVLLARGRREQALVEYRLAIGGKPRPAALLREVFERFPLADDAARAIPPDYGKPRRMVQTLIELDRPDVAIGYLLRAIEGDRKNRLKLELLVDLASRQLRWDAAEVALQRLVELDGAIDRELALARVMIARGHTVDALAVLARALERERGGTPLVEARLLAAETHARGAAWREARAVLEPLRTVTGLDLPSLRRLHQQLAVIEDALGNRRQAEWERTRLRELSQKDRP